MAKLCDCPGETVYEKGKVRVEVWADTEDKAMTALEAKLPQAKKDAEAAQTAAYRAALKVGDAACKAGVPPCNPCKAIFWGTPVEGPWKAVGAEAPYNRWLARGGYNWKVMVECECPPAVVAIKDEDEQQRLKA